MTKGLSVNVGLHIGSNVIDLRIPRVVRNWHLKRVISEAFLMMYVKFPADFELRLIGKPFEVSNLLLYDEYAIDDGDQIEVVFKNRTEQ